MQEQNKADPSDGGVRACADALALDAARERRA
jgi:hypothetical protein